MIKDQIADQLVYSTVRIVCRDKTTLSRGTGFFMRRYFPDKTNINAIVTNNHVVDGYDYAEITLAGIDENGMPDDKNHVTITINDLQKRRISHPDKNIDVCLLFVNDKIEEYEKAGKSVYYKAVGTEMTLLPTDYDSLTSIEDVIMIGYPNGIMDTYNNKPVVRKGITATSLKLDYNGTPDFMVDIACFYGSSGSPVFLRKEGLAKETTDKGLTIGLSPSYSLLGIIHSMSIAKASGEIVVKEIPTSMKPIVETTIPLNLGQVTKAKKILEIFDLVKARHIK
ncbi:MAG: trypsin-like peptidase domain-containing protein [Oscillospiraceae bacterium]|nr:trypsin-like peptidase domain-containing protein [Oscillospiraceae bacterium]